MLQHADKMSLNEIDWPNWKAVDPATLVFLRRENQVLLIRKKRGLGAGKINGPGGRFEPGETALECAIRETREEVGLTPHELDYRGDNRFQFVDGYSIHVHVFVSTSYSGQLRETEEAIPIWTPIDRIPYDEMWEDDRLWLPLALDGTRFSARYIFEGDRMIDHQLELS
jgi:8-oxo-dGTP diphosphatase